MPDWKYKAARKAERLREYEEREAQAAQKRKEETDTAMETYAGVSDRLAELGIDPVELRDFLNALP